MYILEYKTKKNSEFQTNYLSRYSNLCENGYAKFVKTDVMKLDRLDLQQKHQVTSSKVAKKALLRKVNTISY